MAPDKVQDNILKILKNGHTPQAQVWAEVDNQHFSGTFCANQIATTFERDDTEIYGIASLTKLMVACAVCMLIEDSEDSKSPIHWEDPIDKHIGHLGVHFPATVTIEKLLYHGTTLPVVTDILLAHDGNVLGTKGTFLAMLDYFSKQDDNEVLETSEQRLSYNNAGYILVAILFECRSTSGDTQDWDPRVSFLGKFIEERILTPLGMQSTIVSQEKFEEKRSQGKVSQPHLVSLDKDVKPIEHLKYFDNTVVFPAMGVYSSARDYALFLRALLAAYTEGGPSRPDRPFSGNTATMVFHNHFRTSDQEGNGFGVSYTDSLQSATIGHNSLNHAILQARQLQEPAHYTLGYNEKRLPKGSKIFTHGGASTGYSCCFYLIPEVKGIFVVLTNATGLGDSADYISRLLLQEYLDLEPKRDFTHMALLGQEAHLAFVQEKLMQTPPSGLSALETSDIVGDYFDNDAYQSITLRDEDGRLFAQIRGMTVDGEPAGTSTEIRAVRTSNGTLDLRPWDSASFARMGIDIFVSWSLLELAVSQDQKGRVIGLRRDRTDGHSVYYGRL